MSQHQCHQITPLVTETESLQIQNTDIEEMVVDCSYSDSNMDTILLSEDEEEYEEHYRNLFSDEEHSQLAGVSGLLDMLRGKNPPIDTLASEEVSERMISFLKHPNEQLRSQALSCLVNLSAGNQENIVNLVDQGALTELISTVKFDPEQNLRSEACWVLGNIAGDCVELRDEVLSAGAMDAVLEFLQTSTITATASWALCNLCMGLPHPPSELMHRVIPVAAQLIESSDHETVRNALGLLAYLSDSNGGFEAAIASGNVCRRLVMFLGTNDMYSLVLAVRTIAGLLTGDSDTVRTVIDNGALAALLPLLSHSLDDVRKEACHAISNVMVIDEKHIQSLIDAGIIPQIFDLLNDESPTVRIEAGWCFSNAIARASCEQLSTFINLDILPSLCSLLLDEDDHLVETTLEALAQVLQQSPFIQDNAFVEKIAQSGGLHALECLTNYKNPSISRRSKGILDGYFQKP